MAKLAQLAEHLVVAQGAVSSSLAFRPRKKDGECRVFGAVDVNFPVEGDAAFNNQFVHENILGCVSGYRLADKRSATGRGVVF